MTGLAALTSLAVASPVSYLAAVAIPALDALIPLLPSETAVIALGAATAGSHDPRIAVLVALAACGAFLGDNLAYLVGRRFGPFARRGCSPGRAAASGWTGPGGRWNGTAPASSWPAGSSRADAPR